MANTPDDQVSNDAMTASITTEFLAYLQRMQRLHMLETVASVLAIVVVILSFLLYAERIQ